MHMKSSLVEYATAELTTLGKISNRGIFGGVGIFIEGRLLGIVYNDVLYLHTGPSNREDYEKRGMEQFKPYPKAFDLTTDHHQVPSDVLADPQQLRQWGERALRAARDAARAKQLAGIARSRHEKQAARRAKKAQEAQEAQEEGQDD